MATNNKLIDFNKNLRKTDTAFNAYINNLPASTYSYNIEALIECHNKLPIEWRNANEIYLAGAWNVGNIIGYNSNGHFISLPFTRASSARGIINNLQGKVFAVDEPNLCMISVARSWGLQLFETYTYSGSGIFNTTPIGSWTKYSEVNGQAYTDAGYTRYFGTYGSQVYVGHKGYIFIDVTDIVGTRFFEIALSRGSNGNRLRIYPNNTTEIIGALTIENLNFFNSNNRKIVTFRFQSGSTGNHGIDVYIRDINGAFTGNSSISFSIGFMYFSELSFQNRPINISTRAEDILNITLSQPSDIFINTSIGSFIFYNQPVGVFDYKSHGIINCKLYNIAIKHA